MSNSSPTPAPNAVIMVRISSLLKTLSSRDFSTLRIFPFSGRIAWNLRSLACLHEPPAESPSTRYSSHNAGSFSEQSASLPGKPADSKAPFLRVSSLALRAASLARLASSDFSSILFATLGFSSRNAPSFSFTVEATRPSNSELPSFVFVWPSNCGSGTHTLIIAVTPSRTSSPANDDWFDLSSFLSLQY